MSAATKAKIAAAQKGNKNAYRGGPKKTSSYKTKQNKGYTTRRKIAVGALAVASVAASPSILGGAALGYAAGRVHRKGKAKAAAKSNKTVLLKVNRKGNVKKAYVPHAPRPSGRRKKK